jgi:hypothetical protein
LVICDRTLVRGIGITDNEQHLDNLRRKGVLREAETIDISVHLGNYSASHFEGSANVFLIHTAVSFASFFSPPRVESV